MIDVPETAVLAVYTVVWALVGFATYLWATREIRSIYGDTDDRQ